MCCKFVTLPTLDFEQIGLVHVNGYRYTRCVDQERVHSSACSDVMFGHT